MWRRYVAIGDSSTEGLDDPDGSGGFRGWADRLAEALAVHQGGVEYANLAIRGKTAAQIRADQLPAALRLAPDLATVVAGMNDLMGGAFDAAAVAVDIEAMIRALQRQGVTVLTFTLPDPTPNFRFAGHLTPRLRALNDQVRLVAARTGAIMVDFSEYEWVSDPRLWAADRLHGNSQGHAIVAHALAHALGIPDADESWREPPPPLPSPGALRRLADDATWLREYALPWLWRTLRGRSLGDDRSPKRPEPTEASPRPDWRAA